MAKGRRINTRVVSDIETGRILERHGFDYIGKIARAMGVRFPTVTTTTFIGPLPASAAETVVLTTPGISEPIDNAQVILAWFFDLGIGVGNTSVTVNLRRGSTVSGTSIRGGTWNQSVTAGQANIMAGFYIDSPGIVAGQQYSLTLVQTAATGAGTWNDGCLLAMVL